MARAPKKLSTVKKAKLRRPLVKTSKTKQEQTIAELRHDLAESLQRESATAKELQERNRDLTEALNQQRATSEVLKVISQSALDLDAVLDTLVEKATKLCGATQGIIFRFDGEVFRAVADHGALPEHRDFWRTNVIRPGRGSATGRAALERRPIQIPDVHEDPEYKMTEGQRAGQFRTLLSVPMLREGNLIGAIGIWRTEVQPFTDKQIELVTTFADQAVIAIENVRLFQELTESLEQQTATSEILGVIASSPTDIRSVLDVVAENAARVCGANDANIFMVVEGSRLRKVATYGPIGGGSPIGFEARLDSGLVSTRTVVDRQTIHIHDFVAVADEYSGPQSRALQRGYRTMLSTPLLREGVAIGMIGIRRLEVKPFTEKQIALLKTFADQAVIAIENVRLFKEIQERNAELREALEHQTATAEVLGIISRSPTDVQPVLDAIVESAARVCGIDDVALRLRDGDMMIPRAHFGSVPVPSVAIDIDAPPVRWVREHGTLHIPDIRMQNDIPLVAPGPKRTFLLVPLRLQGELIGALIARRTEVCPFTPAQIKLLETFADQAVIAIENVRLFNELKESLEQQTATSEILGVIASSPTDIQPVLDVVAENAARLCEASNAQVFRLDGNVLRLVANHGGVPSSTEAPIRRGSPLGRIFLDRKTLHVHDLKAELETEFPDAKASQRRLGHRTILGTPLLREGVPVGVIGLRRTEVRPFTDKQIKLLETFAAQAVIAIENVRLFKELTERNAELREALEHQTATSEVLGIISRSPTEVQPILDAIVESAARVCGIDDVVLRLKENDFLVPRAHFGSIPVLAIELSSDRPEFRWIRERGTVHIPDVQAQNEFPTLGSVGGWRTFLAAPLRQHGEFIGVLTARRVEVRPFTPAQIKLLESFADQAVIAIENVRLFQELQESLEQQTATSEILGVIASSPTDIQPVLNVIAENAGRICGMPDVAIFRIEDDGYRVVATYGSAPVQAAGEIRALDRGSVAGRAMVDRQIIHIHDVRAVQDDFWRVRTGAVPEGFRTMLAIPLLRESTPIGAIVMRRTEVQPFTEKQIALLKTFADQAVIAIENVRLFKELQERNRDITEALEQQTERDSPSDRQLTD